MKKLLLSITLLLSLNSYAQEVKLSCFSDGIYKVYTNSDMAKLALRAVGDPTYLTQARIYNVLTYSSLEEIPEEVKNLVSEKKAWLFNNVPYENGFMNLTRSTPETESTFSVITTRTNPFSSLLSNESYDENAYEITLISKLIGGTEYCQ